jgi:ACR3 family arsenite efflux pump ArsB
LVISNNAIADVLAVGLIVMMYPILCKVRFEELNLIFKQKAIWKQLAFSFVVNWLIAPLVMVNKSFLQLLFFLAWFGMGISPG